MGTNGAYVRGAHDRAFIADYIAGMGRDMVFPAGGAQSWRNGSADTTNCIWIRRGIPFEREDEDDSQ